VLVGGRNRRMGTDKALIEIDGNLGHPVVPDRFRGQRPLAGIEAAQGATAAAVPAGVRKVTAALAQLELRYVPVTSATLYKGKRDG
jgi:hypothetical protein